MSHPEPNDNKVHTLFRASDHINDGKHHILLAATGSVATIKLPLIATALSQHDNVSIRIVVTNAAAEFLQGQADEQPHLESLATLSNVAGVYRDVDEWRKPWVRGDNILHIELRRWADLMVIAPLSANSLAKLAVGLSDDLVSSVVRAWDTTGLIDAPRPNVSLPYVDAAGVRRKGIMVAPSMNTAMWRHPITARHIATLQDDWGVANGGWFDMLPPIDKGLACGDTGSGAMHEWKDIVTAIEARLQLTTPTITKTK